MTRNLVKNHKLVQHFEKYLANEINDFTFEYEPKRGDTAWHPSGDCIPSPSSLYDKATGATEPEVFGVGLMKTFMVGHFWHQLLQKAVVDLELAPESAIERKGKKVWDWYEVTDLPSEIIVDPATGVTSTTPQRFPKPYHWATGAGDVAPCDVPNFGEAIVDFKTMSSHQFKQNGVPEWAANKYEAQINVYMDFFELDKAIIFCINKDGPHDFKEFHYERNQPLIDAMYEKWHFVSSCIDAEVRPDEECDAEFDVEPLCKGPIK